MQRNPRRIRRETRWRSEPPKPQQRSTRQRPTSGTHRSRTLRRVDEAGGSVPGSQGSVPEGLNQLSIGYASLFTSTSVVEANSSTCTETHAAPTGTRVSSVCTVRTGPNGSQTAKRPRPHVTSETSTVGSAPSAKPSDREDLVGAMCARVTLDGEIFQHYRQPNHPEQVPNGAPPSQQPLHSATG